MATTAAEASAGQVTPKLIFGRFRFWLFMVGLVVILTGLLFGYDQGVISGALQFIAKDFHLSTTLQEVVTSWVTLGALVGALLAGGLADRLGRQKAMVIGGVLFAMGALGESLAPGTWVLVVSRFVVGFGVGIASVAGPLYAAEMAPSSTRGRYVSSYQLAVTIGILLADISDAVLSSGGRWRLMLGLSVVPGVLLVLVSLVMPDTPRWYMRVDRRADAKACLAKTLGGDVDGRPGNIQRELSDSKDVGWKDVLAPGLRRALWVGIGLAVFQQVTGINAVIYYSDKIFGLAGFPLAGAFRILDHHPTTGGGPSVTGIVTLIAMVVYIASFAFSLGPVVWTLISEIFPNRIRGRAMAVATAFNWLAAFIVSASFLSIMNAIGAGATFLMFAVLCVIAFFWVRGQGPGDQRQVAGADPGGLGRTRQGAPGTEEARLRIRLTTGNQWWTSWSA